MSYVNRRAGTHRRGQAAEVDTNHLTNLIVRRCRGCDPQTYYEVTERFFEAQPGKFGDEVQEAVRLRLERRLAKAKPKPERARSGVNGSVLCTICGRRYYDHPADEKMPWRVVLCDGSKARVW